MGFSIVHRVYVAPGRVVEVRKGGPNGTAELEVIIEDERDGTVLRTEAFPIDGQLAFTLVKLGLEALRREESFSIPRGYTAGVRQGALDGALASLAVYERLIPDPADDPNPPEPFWWTP